MKIQTKHSSILPPSIKKKRFEELKILNTLKGSLPDIFIADKASHVKTIE